MNSNKLLVRGNITAASMAYLIIATATAASMAYLITATAAAAMASTIPEAMARTTTLGKAASRAVAITTRTQQPLQQRQQ